MDKQTSGDPLDEMTLIDKAFASIYSRCWIDTPEYGSVHMIEAEFRQLEAENARLREAGRKLLRAMDNQFEPANSIQFPPGTFEYALDNERLEAAKVFGESEGQ